MTNATATEGTAEDKAITDKPPEIKSTADRFAFGGRWLDLVQCVSMISQLETIHSVREIGVKRDFIQAIRDLMKTLGFDSPSLTQAYKYYHSVEAYVMYIPQGEPEEVLWITTDDSVCSIDLLDAKLAMEELEEKHSLAKTGWAPNGAFIDDVAATLAEMAGKENPISPEVAIRAWRRSFVKMQELKKSFEFTP